MMCFVGKDGTEIPVDGAILIDTHDEKTAAEHIRANPTWLPWRYQSILHDSRRAHNSNSDARNRRYPLPGRFQSDSDTRPVNALDPIKPLVVRKDNMTITDPMLDSPFTADQPLRTYVVRLDTQTDGILQWEFEAEDALDAVDQFTEDITLDDDTFVSHITVFPKPQ